MEELLPKVAEHGVLGLLCAIEFGVIVKLALWIKTLYERAEARQDTYNAKMDEARERMALIRDAVQERRKRAAG